MITKNKGRGSMVKPAVIDLTPIIDCAFLLLIFFMLTTVFVNVKGLQVDLPAPGEQSQDNQQKKRDVNIQVTANGEYIVAGSPVPSEALASAIKGAMDENNNRNVIIQGDPQASHGAVVFAMDKAAEVGAEGMAFAVEQAQGEEESASE